MRTDTVSRQILEAAVAHPTDTAAVQLAASMRGHVIIELLLPIPEHATTKLARVLLGTFVLLRRRLRRWRLLLLRLRWCLRRHDDVSVVLDLGHVEFQLNALLQRLGDDVRVSTAHVDRCVRPSYTSLPSIQTISIHLPGLTPSISPQITKSQCQAFFPRYFPCEGIETVFLQNFPLFEPTLQLLPRR